MEQGGEDTKFCDWARQLEKKDPKKIRIFDRKDYFAVYGQQALILAEEYFRTRDVVKMLGSGKEEKLASLAVRPSKLPRILRAVLMERKEACDMYTQDEKSGEWRVTRKGNAANTAEFDELIYAGEDAGLAASTAVMAAKLGTSSNGLKIWGLAWCDVNGRTLELCELEDNERYSNFESVLVQHGSRECFIGYDKTPPATEVQKIQEILERCEISMSERKAAAFKVGEMEKELKILLGSIEHHLGQFDKKHALASLSCLIKEFQLLKMEESFGRWKLRSFDLSQYMKLDQAAMVALNLFPSETEADKLMTLYGVLNKCKTAMGSRLLAQWIKQPLVDASDIEHRLDFVEIFVKNPQLRQAIQDDHLRGVPDLDRITKRFRANRANLQVVMTVYTWLLRLPSLVAFFKDYTGIHAESLQSNFTAHFENVMTNLRPFEAMVEQTVDLEALDRHEYLINASFNTQLEQLAKTKKKLTREMEILLDTVAADLDLDTTKVKLNHATTLGWHFRISRKMEKNLRKKKSYLTLETRKDGVRFTTHQMKLASKKLIETAELYDKAQEEIVKSALDIAASFVPVLEDATEVLAELDVLVSFAHVGVSAPTHYIRPVIPPQGGEELLLEDSRHPCMELLEVGKFIPNDIKLVKGQSNIQVITGPNMGGKSTYIRQAGVIVLMAQIGCFVPCGRAIIPICDCILARVGAGDSQLKGVSTFMKEMLEASAILKEATSNSLVVIDELGRGTSTYDGFGLAWAISEHIARNIGCFALFATHFHELTGLSYVEPSVVNKHVTALATSENITMLYKVQDGPCDRSFGIHVSELAQFPKSVIEAAKRKAIQLEDFGSQADLFAKVKVKQGARKRIRIKGKMGSPSVNSTTGVPPQLEEKATFLTEFAALPIKSTDSDQAIVVHVNGLMKKYQLSGSLSSFSSTKRQRTADSEMGIEE